MAETRENPKIHWVDPHHRGIIPLDRFHVSRSLARTIRREIFHISVNNNFSAVVEGCADRDDTWINAEIFQLYKALHDIGFAHSIEVYDEGALVGGVYGVAMGGAFFGESMFSRRTDASKVALAYLVDRLNAGGFTLLDTQFLTPHLASLGAVEISRAQYQKRLEKALSAKATFFSEGYVPQPSLISSMGSSGVSGGSSASGATKPESQERTHTS